MMMVMLLSGPGKSYRIFGNQFTRKTQYMPVRIALHFLEVEFPSRSVLIFSECGNWKVEQNEILLTLPTRKKNLDHQVQHNTYITRNVYLVPNFRMK